MPLHLTCNMSEAEYKSLQANHVHRVSSEGHRKQVEDFCKFAGLPCPLPFVSVGVWSVEPHPGTPLDAYGGKRVVLRPEIVHRVVVASAGDFNQRAYEGYHIWRKSAKQGRKHLEAHFLNTVRIGNEQRLDALITFASNNIDQWYVEGRLEGGITLDDVDRVA